MTEEILQKIKTLEEQNKLLSETITEIINALNKSTEVYNENFDTILHRLKL